MLLKPFSKSYTVKHRFSFSLVNTEDWRSKCPICSIHQPTVSLKAVNSNGSVSGSEVGLNRCSQKLPQQRQALPHYISCSCFIVKKKKPCWLAVGKLSAVCNVWTWWVCVISGLRNMAEVWKGKAEAGALRILGKRGYERRSSRRRSVFSATFSIWTFLVYFSRVTLEVRGQGRRESETSSRESGATT